MYSMGGPVICDMRQMAEQMMEKVAYIRAPRAMVVYASITT